jgi:hypothetical protein
MIESDHDSNATAAKIPSKAVEELELDKSPEGLSDRNSSQLTDSKLSCVIYKTKDIVGPGIFSDISEDGMIDRARNLDQKAKERWNWLKTPYLKKVGDGDNEDDAEIHEILEDATNKFGSLLFLAEEDTKDILNAFYYFDHLC